MKAWYERSIGLPIPKKSFFLFGPRQTGKTTLVEHCLSGRDALKINLLDSNSYLKYKANPGLLADEIRFYARNAKEPVVFIDEIQKMPELLDGVHLLIDEFAGKICFILTGSSARKMRRASANLLAGRAWNLSLHPLTHVELSSDFDLGHALRFGTLPFVIGTVDNESTRTLDAYVGTYLKEEIISEALVRNVSAFSRFLELACDSSGELVNYSNISRETATASKTIREYYQILEDTMLCHRLDPYLKSIRRRIIAHPKYYIFDTGVVNAGAGRISSRITPGTALYGRMFEHFVFLELKRLADYSGKGGKFFFWRTSNGLEVDIVFDLPDERLYAIEIKSSGKAGPSDCKGLKAFKQEFPDAELICVTNGSLPHEKNGIKFLPWRYFFSKELRIA